MQTPAVAGEARAPFYAPASLASAALTYARHGWRVLPVHTIHDSRCTCGHVDCEHPGKHPILHNGLTGASSDEGVVADWWRRWSLARIGLAVPDGWLVIDVDDFDAFADLAARGLHLPDTLTAATSRGQHWYYRVRRRVAPKVAILPHVDLRGPGSYVIAPPSPGYRWLSVPEHEVPYLELD